MSGSAADFGYASYFHHGVSGLEFAMYRAYDSAHARWLDRDPIAEAGGINLYAYVGGRPISISDPLGLFWMAGDPINQTAANAVTGFGDGIYQVVTLGIGNLNAVRDFLGWVTTSIYAEPVTVAASAQDGRGDRDCYGRQG